MRKIMALLIGALAACAAWASDITENQARTVAEYFIAKDTIGMRILPERTVDVVTKRGGLWLVTLKPSGHLFVSVNRSAEPIPSFSENDFTEPEADSPQAALLAVAETNSVNATGTKYESRWRTMLDERTLRLTTSSVKTAATTTYVNIEPMVKSSWTQNYPYNELTPIVNGSHTLVGCVGTAYSQVLRFWEWPEVLDEDIVTEHTVDGMWGHKWRLKAGTEFDWQGMPYSGGYDNATRLKLGRGAMFAGMLARMTYNTKASGAQTAQPGQNRWYTAPRVFDTANSELADREEAMKQSLLDGCPFMVSVNYGTVGHAVVGDGWQENANGKYVHLNYGWGSADNIYYGTSTALGVYLNQKPRPMVMNKPMPTSAKLPVTVEWSFPTKGYADTLTGFDITYAEVEDTAADWQDDMSVGTGTIDGDCISVETVDETDHGNVMRVGTKAEDETYTWPTMVATKDTVLSYDIHSYNALGMTVEVQLLDPSIGWVTLTTPEIGEKSEIEWTNHSFKLGDYAGKGIAIRVKATRFGSSSYNDDTARSTGVQFDNIKLTKVRQAKAGIVGTASAEAGARAASVSDSNLAVNKTYLFQVTPKFSDDTEGISGYEAACTIAAADTDKPTITSVESVSTDAPKMQDGMFRECYFGLNQFGVYGSEATTELEAYLSDLVVIGEVEIQDTTQPAGTMITVHDKVSIENAVTVEKKEDGKFLVKVDVSNLTTYLNYTGMILTLIGRNDEGDAVQKDICLRFTKSGSETEIAAANLPDAGTVSGGGSDTPSTPVTTSYTVSFATMGGTSVSYMTVESGKAIGTLPTSTREGYTFLGWFTAISGGEKVTTDTVITKSIIVYAQWQENTPAVTTYTVTFDPNGGTPEMSRFVNENAAVGTLPTTVTKSGYQLTGWYTAKDGGEKISASQVITGNVTYYAHWEVSSGGGTGGGSTDDGSTRFCHGVSKTAGAYDVTRLSGYTNRLIPTGCNLIFWWVDRYEEVYGSFPAGYDETKVTANQNDGNYTIQSYVAKLIGDSNLSQTLPEGLERDTYFPTTQYSANDWYGTGAQETWAKEAGKRIYAALANGPIGIKVPTSSSYYFGAVIWGCDYAVDGNDKYATALYITDTTTNKRSDQVVRFEFGLYTNGYGTYPGIKNFNGTGYHGIIEYYYPIVGPAGTSQPDDPVVVTTHKVTFDADGGTEVDSILVEDGSTISTLPATVKSGYTFLGWFNGSEELTTATKISSDVTYTAHWQKKVVTPTTYTVVFDANGGTVSEVSREVSCNAAVGELPVPTYAGHLFGGWYLGSALIDKATVVSVDVVYVAQWTLIDPAEDEPIDFASNDNNPGNNYSASYQYEMYDNYYTARKRAIQQGKQLFVLSGASWCSNCAFVKSYLTTLGAEFTDKFVVYYSNHDDDVSSPYFHGGLPQYGAADPRAIDAFTGTLDGTTRTWSSVWTTAGCGIYKQDRGGYASDRVDTVVAAGQAKAAYSYPTELVIRGLSTLATGYAGQYELYARFADGVEMPVDYGVTWSVVSGNGSLAKANVDGREVTSLTITSGDVILRARSTFYFTGTKTITVKSTDLSNVEFVAINTTSVNLEDDATPLIDAVATMKDGSQIAVVGFGDWSAKFKSRIDRKDADLEEENVTPTITFDGNSRLTYAKTGGTLAVCDQKIDVTLTVNGKSDTKEITVWGPTKVAPSAWKMISGPKQTALGVVRLQCTELKYNYGGQILTTKDTYFASYKTVLKQGSTVVDTSLRGLTAYAFSEQGSTCTVGLAATKVNGKYTGYTPADPTTSKLATNFTNVAKGTIVTDMSKGAVPTGFFQAFFPNADASTFETLAEEDSDGDGFKNWEEYVLGTDPTNKSDAFTLMQGYQHLAAPAASGDTMQYKVMYQQRARRIYYIEAKKTWSEEWTPVAKVSLANAEEGDVTSFKELNASYADAAKFFRVRASLYEHVFTDPTTAPKITPNMLVAAPGAIIDLSDGSALDLSSFDTDATDPGTVWVKVVADVKKGTALITAPKAAEKSLKACKPYERTDIAFAVVEADGKLVLKVAEDAPAIEGGDEKGTVAVTDEKIVVTPNENVTEITIDHPGERKIEIPPSIEKIGGVTDSGKIVVKSGSHDVTKAMKFTAEGSGFTVELDANAKVTVDSEEISVTPELASGSDETPFEIKDGQLVFKVKSIPGLKYKVLVSDSLDPNDFGSTEQGTGAESSRCELKVDQPSGKTQGFYKIQVSR